MGPAGRALCTTALVNSMSVFHPHHHSLVVTSNSDPRPADTQCIICYSHSRHSCVYSITVMGSDIRFRIAACREGADGCCLSQSDHNGHLIQSLINEQGQGGHLL